MKHNFPFVRVTVIVVILVIVILVHYIGILRPIERTLQSGINMIGGSLYNTKITSVQWLLHGVCQQSNQSSQQQEIVNQLTAENAQLNQQLRDLQQIKDLVGYTSTQKQHTVIARVVGVVQQPGTHALILDKGLADGIKEQYAVVGGNGILIGKTSFVTDTTSQLILLNDRRSTVAASLASNPKATGLVQGEFGLSIVMNMIPSNESITQNDIVITSGFENGIPGGLVLGTIDQIHHDDAALFASATVLTPARYDQLHIVSVILPQ